MNLSEWVRDGAFVGLLVGLPLMVYLPGSGVFFGGLLVLLSVAAMFAAVYDVPRRLCRLFQRENMGRVVCQDGHPPGAPCTCIQGRRGRDDTKTWKQIRLKRRVAHHARMAIKHLHLMRQARSKLGVEE